MKAITSFLSVVAALAGTALADNPQLRIDLDLQRSRMEAERSREVAAQRESGQISRETSIALFAGERGVGTTERTRGGTVSSRRNMEPRATIVNTGRGERTVIRQ